MKHQWELQRLSSFSKVGLSGNVVQLSYKRPKTFLWAALYRHLQQFVLSVEQLQTQSLNFIFVGRILRSCRGCCSIKRLTSDSRESLTGESRPSWRATGWRRQHLPSSPFEVEPSKSVDSDVIEGLAKRRFLANLLVMDGLITRWLRMGEEDGGKGGGRGEYTYCKVAPRPEQLGSDY